MNHRQSGFGARPGCGVESRQRSVVLPGGLADRSAHHNLENLVLAEAGCLRGGEVLAGDRVGMSGDLIDDGARRTGEPGVGVIERSVAQGVRRGARSLDDPCGQRFPRLADVRHTARNSLVAIQFAASIHPGRAAVPRG